MKAAPKNWRALSGRTELRCRVAAMGNKEISAKIHVTEIFHFYYDTELTVM